MDDLIAHIRRSAMNHLPQQFTSLIELTDSTDNDRLIAALKVLRAHNTDFFVLPPPTLMGLQFKRYDDGAYRAVARAQGQNFPHSRIETSEIDGILKHSSDSVSPEKIYYTTSRGEDMMIRPLNTLRVKLYQLFVKADLQQSIITNIRKLSEQPKVTSSAGVPAIPPSPKLSEVMKEFAAFKKKRWGDKTTDEFATHLRTFVQMVGDKEVLQLNNDDCSYYINNLPRIPLNFSQNPQYRGMKLNDVLAMPDQPKVLAPKTVKQYFGTVRAFIKFAKVPHKSINTFLLELAPETNERDDAKDRVAFRQEHLFAIFESDKSIDFLKRLWHPYQVWIAPIGLYTGARLGEICALRLEDFGEEDGITYIQFNDKERKDKTRKGKTKNAVRRIPIHNQLVQLGLLKFVEKMRKADPELTKGRLFPECTKIKNHGYRKAASDWFGVFLDHLGITGREFVFHTWRHTALTKFNTTPNHPDSWMLDVYCGHAIKKTESESVRLYLYERKVSTLLPVIDTLKWSIDWTRYSELCARTYR